MNDCHLLAKGNSKKHTGACEVIMSKGSWKKSMESYYHHKSLMERCSNQAGFLCGVVKVAIIQKMF
jgi:hypothetical protein